MSKPAFIRMRKTVKLPSGKILPKGARYPVMWLEDDGSIGIVHSWTILQGKRVPLRATLTLDEWVVS